MLCLEPKPGPTHASQGNGESRSVLDDNDNCKSGSYSAITHQGRNQWMIIYGTGGRSDTYCIRTVSHPCEHVAFSPQVADRSAWYLLWRNYFFRCLLILGPLREALFEVHSTLAEKLSCLTLILSTRTSGTTYGRIKHVLATRTDECTILSPG